MSEEIIIDGVNVAGCGYFNEIDKECNICGMGTGGEDTFCRDCKDNSNCYYKQLKRLQAENEELKKQIEKQKNAKVQLKNLDNRFADDYCKVKAENEQLKALCDTYFTCYRAKHNDIEGNLFSYRKALEEIQKMFSEPCIEGENCFTCNSNCLNKDVLNITSEVLDEQ